MTTLDPDHLMIDPPEGWRYGFPKLIPREHQHPTLEWLVEQGYPKELITERHFVCRYWTEARDD